MRKLLTAAALVAGAFAAAPASAQDGVELGMLDCIVEGGLGDIISSSREVACTFTPTDASMPAEPYFGVINKYGLDIGPTGEAVMQWLVLAPTEDEYGPGALEGDYVGASAGASVGVGASANVLVGGSEDTISLQPVSVQAQTGLNLALGVTEFQLRSPVD